MFKDLRLGDAHLVPLPPKSTAADDTNSDDSVVMVGEDVREYVCLVVVLKTFNEGHSRTVAIDAKVRVQR